METVSGKNKKAADRDKVKKQKKVKNKKTAIILLNVSGNEQKNIKETHKVTWDKNKTNETKVTAELKTDTPKNKTAKAEIPKLPVIAVHKSASIGWKYFLDKHGLPLMKIYTENPGVFFKLEKITDVKKSARYYTHKGDLIGADFIIPHSMIETACNIAGIKTPKNLLVLQPAEQQAAL
jgi:hypothetical protein